MTKLLGKERYPDPLAKLATPDHFENIDASSLDDLETEASLLPFVTRKIRVENGGDLAVLKRDGTLDVLPALADGETVVVSVAKLMDTGTTVTGRITVFY
jgi:hypothetical protein